MKDCLLKSSPTQYPTFSRLLQQLCSNNQCWILDSRRSRSEDSHLIKWFLTASYVPGTHCHSNRGDRLLIRMCYINENKVMGAALASYAHWNTVQYHRCEGWSKFHLAQTSQVALWRELGVVQQRRRSISVKATSCCRMRV